VSSETLNQQSSRPSTSASIQTDTGCDIEFANEYTCGFIPVVYDNETLLAFDVEAEVADCMF
jgi:hypothetical protein